MTARTPGESMRAPLIIARDHAAYPGHFPGFPVLPGAALLDAALEEICRSRAIDLRTLRIASAKFLGMVRPGDELDLEHTAPNGATIRFTILCGGNAVAAGILSHDS